MAIFNFNKIKNTVLNIFKKPEASKDSAPLDEEIIVNEESERISKEKEAVTMSNEPSRNAEAGGEDGLEKLEYIEEVSSSIKNVYVESIQQAIASEKIDVTKKAELIKKTRELGGRILQGVKEKATKENIIAFLAGVGVKGVVKTAGISLGLGAGLGTAGVLGLAAFTGALTKGLMEAGKQKFKAVDGNKLIDKLNSLTQEKILDLNSRQRLAEIIVESNKKLKDGLVEFGKDEYGNDRNEAGTSQLFYLINDARVKLKIASSLESSLNDSEILAKIIKERLGGETELEGREGLAERKKELAEVFVGADRTLGKEEAERILKSALAGLGLGFLGGLTAHISLDFIKSYMPEELLPKGKDLDDLNKVIKLGEAEDIKSSIPSLANNAIETDTPSVYEFKIDDIPKGSGLYENLQRVYPNATFEEIKALGEQGLKAQGLIGESQNIDAFIESGKDREMSPQKIADILNKIPHDSTDIELPQVNTLDISDLDVESKTGFIPEGVITNPENLGEAPKPPEVVSKTPWNKIIGGSIAGVGAGVLTWLGYKKYKDIKDKKMASNGNDNNISEQVVVSPAQGKIDDIEGNKILTEKELQQVEEQEVKIGELLDSNDSENKAEIEKLRNSASDFELASIDDKEKQRIFDNINLRNSRTDKDGNEFPRMLANKTSADLVEVSKERIRTYIEKHPELLPQKSIELSHDVKANVSKIYNYHYELQRSSGEILKADYNAAVVYIEKEGIIYPRTYYQSGSQGVWRHLPDRKDNNGWFDKGNLVGLDEGHLDAPANLQFALSEMFNEQNGLPVVLESEDETERSELIFAGISPEWYDQFISGQASTGLLSQEQADKLLAGNEIKREYIGKFDKDEFEPEKLIIDPDKEPVFDGGPLKKWPTKSNIFKNDIQSELYASADGVYQYLFNSVIDDDGQKKVWLGSVFKKNGDISTAGNYMVSIDAGHLTMPVWEYSSNIEKYNIKTQLDIRDIIDIGAGTRADKYVSTWPYVQRIPIIKKYMEHKRKQETSI